MNKIEDFIQDGKLVIPENEIDNIYIWNQVSNTQDILMSSESYYKLMKFAFDSEIQSLMPVIKEQSNEISAVDYQFADFLTFTANRHTIFNGKHCLVYANDMSLLKSLICYIVHNFTKYNIVSENLSDFIMHRIDEPEKTASLLDADVLLFKVYGSLPEHKYRRVYLESILSKRNHTDMFTMFYVLNSEFILGRDLLMPEIIRDTKFIDISPLSVPFKTRRASNYREHMVQWYKLLDLKQKEVIYSKEPPKDNKRQARRYR